jgi:hypothetical protein
MATGDPGAAAAPGRPAPAGFRPFVWLAASRPRWLLIGLLLCAALPPFFSWPALPPLPGGAEAQWRELWRQTVQLKVDNPWYDYTRDFPAYTNQAKRTFRVTVPLLAHATGLGMRAVLPLQLLFQLLLLVCLLLAAERACGDRLTALGVALAVAGAYPGTSVWLDHWGWFDNCAQALMLAALVARRPFWAGAAVWAAAFTDERVLITVPLLALYVLWTGGRRALVWAPVLAIPAYLATRLAMAFAFRMHGATMGIAEAGIILPNLRQAAVGPWSALEGGWLLVAGAGVVALRGRHGGRALALAAAALVPVAAAFAVTDYTRSASYAFPAVLVAAALWAAEAGPGGLPALRRWALWAAAVSLLAPNVFVMGRTFVLPGLLFRGWAGHP